MEKNLICKAFELLDNNMYGKRKKSFEKDKESAYQNYSQRGYLDQLLPMDLHFAEIQLQPDILSEVAPPQNSLANSSISQHTVQQCTKSLCLSPSNSDSHSFASFGQVKTFEFGYMLKPWQYNMIDQNQYAQISQQNIDAQIRQRKLIQNQQNQRVSRSKSNNSTIIPNILKDLGLKEEKLETKHKQKTSKKIANQKKQQQQQQQQQNCKQKQ